MLPTTLVIAGESTEIHYDIEEVTLGGGAGDNTLDTSAFPGLASLYGFAGNDTLIAGELADELFGGSGDDMLVAGAGDDVLEGGMGNDSLEGGAGNDSYVQTPGSTDTLTDTQGIDALDLGSATLPVNLDLSTGDIQVVDSAGNSLKLIGTFENVRGTSFGDTIKGNDSRNILAGGGGIDVLEGGGGADTIQASFTQLVYLDFDSATSFGEKHYSIEERNAIQSRLEELYGATFSISFSQTRPAIGAYSTIVVNAGGGDENEVLVGGVAKELDWRNFDPGSIAAVNVNDFLGRSGRPAASSSNFIDMTSTIIAHEVGHLFGLRHSDSFGPIGIAQTTGLPYGIYEGLISKSKVRGEWSLAGSAQVDTATGDVLVDYGLQNAPVLLAPVTQAGNSSSNPFEAPGGSIFIGSTAVAELTVDTSGSVSTTSLEPAGDDLLGGSLDSESGVLTLRWRSVPPPSSIRIDYDYDALRPGYRGPDDARETPAHIMASPASVGSRVDDTLESTYLSERSLIKLAFADASTSLQESDLPTVPAPASLGGTARDMNTLPPLAVPNLLPPGATNYGKQIRTQAINIVGTIEMTTGGSSENDVYAFSGSAGELVTVEILSAVLDYRLLDDIDALVSLYDATGTLIDYYGRLAWNDDGISGSDPLLIDVRLPADGTYYVMVDTFSGGTVPDTDTGGYELFLYKYTVGTGSRQGGGGDRLVGGPGEDVLIGSAGDDVYVGDPSVDKFVAFTEFDLVESSNRPPEIHAVSSNRNSPDDSSADGRIQITGTFGDADPSDLHRVTVDWGDGSAVEELSNVDQKADSFAGTHTYGAGGAYAVSVTVFDDAGASATATTTAFIQGVGLVDGVVYVIGTPFVDSVQATHDLATGKVDVAAGFELDDSGVPKRRETASYPAADVSLIQVWVTNGDDSVQIATTGTAGNGVQLIAARLYGGAGNDLLVGGAGDDLIDGGLGRNVLRGGDGSDRIIGGDESDYIDAGAGNDFVSAGAGHDRIQGGTGDDYIEAGAGYDQVDSGSGDDVVFGQGDNDLIYSLSGNNVFVGGAGHDRLYGWSGRDLLIGGAGIDRLVGYGGEDLLVAGSTDYDADPKALDALMAEWTSTEDYTTRVGNVVGGNGSLSGKGIRLDASTVADDGLADDLYGFDGRDAFFYNYEGSGVFDRAGDVVRTGGTKENTVDL